MLTLEQVKDKIQTDLNALAIELGFVDEDGKPLIYFYGEVSTYDKYSWLKSVQISLDDEELKYLKITPFALILESSRASSGELILEQINEYSFFAYIQSQDADMVREIIEVYQDLENHEDNLTQYGDSKILKKLLNFEIGEEELIGAIDGIPRKQVQLTLNYDMFEERLLTSKDYTLTVDTEEVAYVSFRFEKSNMVIPNIPNASSGTSVSGIAITGSMGVLHEFTLVVDFYVDKESIAVKKLLSDMTSTTKVNQKYAIRIKDTSGNVVDFQQDMVAQGFKFNNQPPQISTVSITFGLAYSRLSIQMKKAEEAIYVTIPILTGKIGHLPAMLTKAYMGDNASKSTIIGGAKGISLVVPVLQQNPLMTAFATEILAKVYTNKYNVKIQFLGVVQEFVWVLSDSSIEVNDAAYDTLQLNFMEAK